MPMNVGFSRHFLTCRKEKHRGLRERCRLTVLKVTLYKMNEEESSSRVECEKQDAHKFSDFLIEAIHKEERAPQLLYQVTHPKLASKGKVGHFHMLVKKIGIRLARVEDLYYLIHFGASSWKRGDARDVTVLTSRWTSTRQYFCPSPYETPMQIHSY